MAAFHLWSHKWCRLNCINELVTLILHAPLRHPAAQSPSRPPPPPMAQKQAWSSPYLRRTVILVGQVSLHLCNVQIAQ